MEDEYFAWVDGISLQIFKLFAAIEQALQEEVTEITEEIRELLPALFLSVGVFHVCSVYPLEKVVDILKNLATKVENGDFNFNPPEMFEI
jgi:hypothetical protein